MNGEQVRLITVPVKVLDDESARAGASRSDASARLASLQSWLAAAGYAALAAWAGFAALTLLPWPRPAHHHRRAADSRCRPQRTFVGLGLLVVGGFLAFSAWSPAGRPTAIALGGQEVTADIVDANSARRRRAYAVRLGLEGRAGGRPPFRPDAGQRGVLEQDHPGRPADGASDRRSAIARTSRRRGR